MSRLDASTLVSGAPKAGDILAGKYRVERMLGSGGMGVVVAATHLELEEQVAVKLLLPHVAQSQETVSRFLREARAAVKIRSEHVVRILDVGRLESSAPYIVMEYLEGRDLAQLVGERGSLPVTMAVDFLLQACEAIAEAHALGIVHRDLKPANLFLAQRPGGEPCIKVLDFGISKEAMRPVGSDQKNPITTTTAILGTPSYMSPEQMRSTRDVDARADVWSMGAILYALLSGAPPYEGESTADICAKIIRDPPPLLQDSRSDVPEGIAYAVARCLEKSPGKRFANVAELAMALVEFGSPDARGSLTRVLSALATRESGRSPIVSADADPTGPARVVISQPPSPGTRTASAWEDTRLYTGGARRRSLWVLAIAGALVAAVLGGVVSFAIWGRPASNHSTATATATATATSTSTTTTTTTTTTTPTATTTTTPTSTPTSTLPSIPVTSLPLAPPIASTPSAPPHTKAPSSPAGALFNDRK